MGKVVVIGSSNMDLIMKVHHIPKPGETVGDGTFYQMHGGKGANQAVAARRAGADVTFVSAIGLDGFGQDMLNQYRKEGIELKDIKTVEGPSGIALINVDVNSGENSISVAPGANAMLLPQDIELKQNTINAADIIVLQNEIPIETVLKSIQLANEYNVKVLYNPAPVRHIDPNHLRLVDILVVNEIEASTLCGTEVTSKIDYESLATKLATLDVDDIIVTLGSQGALHYANGKITPHEARLVKPIDTTGAGDTFCGYLAAMISNGTSISSSISYATAASALAIQSIGAQKAIPLFKAVEQLIRT